MVVPSRRTAREWAVQMLTEADLNPPEDVAAMITAYWKQLADVRPSNGLRKFSEERVLGVLTNLSEIDGILVGLLDNWDLYRIGTVERAVLRLGIWERKYSATPPPVIINECVDIVNWFSSPRSRALVNGVIDKYCQQMAAVAEPPPPPPAEQA